MLEKFPDSIEAKLDLTKYPEIRYNIVLKKQIDTGMLIEKINNAKLLILINEAEINPIIESRGILTWV